MSFFVKKPLAKSITLAATTIVLTAAAASTFAHSTFTENERTRVGNFADRGNPHTLPQPGDDFDFATPFDIQLENALKINVPYPPFEIPTTFRPNVASAIGSALLGRDDYDVFKFTKMDAEPFVFSAYPLVPFCDYAENFQPVIAFAGPLHTVDTNGQPVFSPVPADFPAEAAANLPEGYGVKIIEHEGELKTRDAYHSPHGNNAWFLPQGIVDAGCIEGLGDIEATNASRAEIGLEACDASNTILETISIPGEYFYIVYHADHAKPTKGWGYGLSPNDSNYKWDYSLVTGTQDAFEGYDWARVFARDGIQGFGATNSHTCKLPNYVEYPDTGSEYGG
ncbi:MAG: hypothetical protein HRU20_06190 [Pseudomonadales bacterium]|nr:hypothetical protein [Pseudomonadales bacterium]